MTCAEAAILISIGELTIVEVAKTAVAKCIEWIAADSASVEVVQAINAAEAIVARTTEEIQNGWHCCQKKCGRHHRRLAAAIVAAKTS